ncbi:hypothetical protein LZ30DRAFT_42272 [Colletotrichum cereale]|nr:hypothetical protein LZ30DRAFT_42272 [Colletotrichum cereale]
MQWNVVTQGTPDMEHLVQTPDATPTPLTFEVPTVLSWYNSLFFGEQSSDGWLVVKTPKGLVGVNIHVPVRVASIGTEPYYQVWHDESGADVPNPIPWTTPVDDPAKPYTFPSSVGYQVTVKPTSSGTTLFVNVYIDSLSE